MKRFLLVPVIVILTANISMAFSMGERVLGRCGAGYYRGQILEIVDDTFYKIQFESETIQSACGDEYHSINGPNAQVVIYKPQRNYRLRYGHRETLYSMNASVIARCGWNFYRGTIKDISANGFVLIEFGDPVAKAVCDDYMPFVGWFGINVF